MNLSTHKKSEVELRVAQELKNNQDFIYQTNQAIQRLNENVVALSLAIEKVKNENYARIQYMSSYIDTLDEKLDGFMEDADQRLGAMETRLHIQSAYITKVEDRAKISLTQAQFQDEKERFESLIKDIQDLLKLHKETASQNDSFIKNQINQRIDKVVDQIPPEADFGPFNKKLDEVFGAFKIDFEGLVKEIALLKKASFYSEKKFENIYTLIERLKNVASR